MMIGDIQIPIVSLIQEMNEANVDEIKNNDVGNVVVQHEPDMTMISFGGFLNREAHKDHLPIAEQRKQLETLRERDFENNRFEFRDYDGWLMIENISVIEDSFDSAIVEEVEIEAWYYPYPKFK